MQRLWGAGRKGSRVVRYWWGEAGPADARNRCSTPLAANVSDRPVFAARKQPASQSALVWRLIVLAGFRTGHDTAKSTRPREFRMHRRNRRNEMDASHSLSETIVRSSA